MRMKRSAILLAVIAAVAASPGVAPASADDPFATFTHTENLTPVGSSLRPATSQYNSDLAFSGTKVIQGTYDGFRILDVSVPSQPSQVSFTACGGNQGDVIVQGNLLVRSWNSKATASTSPAGLQSCGGQPVHPGFEGLHIFDISNAAAPVLKGSVFLPCGSHTATGVPDLANGRLLVYNNSSDSTCPWFEIVSVPLATPSAAALLNVAPTGRACHDTAVILGSAMLAACAGGNGMTVLSLGGSRGGTLTEPKQLWTKSVTGVTIGHAASFSWDGEVMIFGHEPGGGAAARCQAADTVNRTVFYYKAVDGTELGTWRMPRAQTAAENCTIHNYNVVPTSDGKRVMVSGNYQSGISVVDFTDPANATEIAYADPAPLGATLVLGGDWSTYWYNGYIYESDITRGLLVWKLDHPAVANAMTLTHANPQTQPNTIANG